MAAVLTMGGYAIAFGVATWLFAAPWLGYFACAAVFAGRRRGLDVPGRPGRGGPVAGDGLRSGWSSGRRAGSWDRAEGPDAYRVPVVRSARAIAALALLFAAMRRWPWGGPSWTAASALWVLASLYC